MVTSLWRHTSKNKSDLVFTLYARFDAFGDRWETRPPRHWLVASSALGWTTVMQFLRVWQDRPSTILTLSCMHRPVSIWSPQIWPHTTCTQWRSALAPVLQHMTYKLSLTTYKAINGIAPGYFTEMCIPISTNSARLRLRSADSDQVIFPRTKTEFWKRVFAYAGPRAWNDLLMSLRSVKTLRGFKSALKTHCFDVHIQPIDFINWRYTIS